MTDAEREEREKIERKMADAAAGRLSSKEAASFQEDLEKHPELKARFEAFLRTAELLEKVYPERPAAQRQVWLRIEKSLGWRVAGEGGSRREAAAKHGARSGKVVPLERPDLETHAGEKIGAEAAQRARSASVRRRFWPAALGLAAMLALAVLAVKLFPPASGPARPGAVASRKDKLPLHAVRGSRGDIDDTLGLALQRRSGAVAVYDAQRKSWRTIVPGERVPYGAAVRTGAGALAELAFGRSRLRLDGKTELTVTRPGRQARVAELTRGRILVDLAKRDAGEREGSAAGRFRVNAAGGQVDLGGAASAVVEISAPAPGVAFARVLKGRAQIATRAADAGGPEPAAAFETGQEVLVAFAPSDEALQALSTPLRARALALAKERAHALPMPKDAAAWAAAFDRPRSKTEASVGQLIVTDEQGRPGEPLTIETMRVTARVSGPMALTRIDQTFRNSTPRTLEGTFYFPLPPGAAISRFAMYVAPGKLVEGEVVERGRARAIYASILRQRRDPALLEWMGGNLFKARIFPIPPRGTKRILLEYTQLLPAHYAARRYVFPLVSELTQKHAIGELSIEVRLDSGNGMPLREIFSPSYYKELRVEGAGEARALARLQQKNIQPRADFVLNFSAPRTSNLFTAAYGEKGEAPYLLLGYQPNPAPAALSAAGVARGRDLLFIVETSGTRGLKERAAQARVLEAMLAGLPSGDDHVAIAATDLGLSVLNKAFLPGYSPKLEGAARRLEKRVSLGALDLGAALQGAAEFFAKRLHAGRERLVVFIGAGVPALGTLDSGVLARQGAAALARVKARFVAVTVGRSVETLALAKLARQSGGFLIPLKMDEDLQDAAFTLSLSLQTPLIEAPLLKDEGDALAQLYPARLGALLPGQEIFLHARLKQARPRSQPLKLWFLGKLAGEPFAERFEVSLPKNLNANPATGRFWARARLDHLLAQPRSSKRRREIIELAKTWTLVSPYTSFLVLESDKDYARYGIERAKRRKLWPQEKPKAAPAPRDGKVGDKAGQTPSSAAKPAELAEAAEGKKKKARTKIKEGKRVAAKQKEKNAFRAKGNVQADRTVQANAKRLPKKKWRPALLERGRIARALRNREALAALRAPRKPAKDQAPGAKPQAPDAGKALARTAAHELKADAAAEKETAAKRKGRKLEKAAAPARERLEEIRQQAPRRLQQWRGFVGAKRERDRALRQRKKLDEDKKELQDLEKQVDVISELQASVGGERRRARRGDGEALEKLDRDTLIVSEDLDEPEEVGDHEETARPMNLDDALRRGGAKNLAAFQWKTVTEKSRKEMKKSTPSLGGKGFLGLSNADRKKDAGPSRNERALAEKDALIRKLQVEMAEMLRKEQAAAGKGTGLERGAKVKDKASRELAKKIARADAPSFKRESEQAQARASVPGPAKVGGKAKKAPGAPIASAPAAPVPSAPPSSPPPGHHAPGALNESRAKEPRADEAARGNRPAGEPVVSAADEAKAGQAAARKVQAKPAKPINKTRAAAKPGAKSPSSQKGRAGGGGQPQTLGEPKTKSLRMRKPGAAAKGSAAGNVSTARRKSAPEAKPIFGGFLGHFAEANRERAARPGQPQEAAPPAKAARRQRAPHKKSASLPERTGAPAQQEERGRGLHAFWSTANGRATRLSNAKLAERLKVLQSKIAAAPRSVPLRLERAGTVLAAFALPAAQAETPERALLLDLLSEDLHRAFGAPGSGGAEGESLREALSAAPGLKGSERRRLLALQPEAERLAGDWLRLAALQTDTEAGRKSALAMQKRAVAAWRKRHPKASFPLELAGAAAALCVRLGDAAQAQAVLDAARQGPRARDPEHLAKIATLEARLGLAASARAHTLQALGATPKTPDTALARLILYRNLAALSDGLGAYRVLADGIKEFGGKGRFAERLARAFIRLIQREKDGETLEDAVVFVTDAGLKGRLLARHAQLEEDPFKKSDLWQRAFEASREDAAYLKPLAESLIGAEKQKEAVKLLERKLREGISRPWMWARLAALYLRAGDTVSALRAMTQEVALRPREAEPRRKLAAALDRMGRGREAIRELQTACALEPRLAPAHRELLKLARKYKDDDAREKVLLAMLNGTWLSADGDMWGQAERGLKALIGEYAKAGKTKPAGALKKKLAAGRVKDIVALMTWNTDKTDIDLHVYEPGGHLVSYRSKSSFRGGVLDHDDTDGRGPETYTLKRATPGVYTIKVHYYGGSGKPTRVTVRLTRRMHAPGETARSVTVELRKIKEEKEVFRFEVPKP